MIVFDLICKDHHRFEGWFASGDDFTSQKGKGLLECPVCGGAHVEKLPAAKIRTQSEAPAVPAANSSMQSDKPAKFDAAAIIDYILAHSEDVGKRFAAEARKIHNQESPQRSIRGVASQAEAEDLREDGIAVFSLPVPPQDRWN